MPRPNSHPLRILFVTHLPWERELGGSRIHLELAEALVKMGHRVDHFCLTNAFPRPPKTRFGHLLRRPFAHYAVRFVRQHGQGYDVIDALEGCLPATKQELDFHGLLVARSLGLGLHYERFEADARRRWPRDVRGKPGIHQLRVLRTGQTRRHERISLAAADVVNVCNSDEAETLAIALPGKRVVQFPFGLAEERRESFACQRDRVPSEDRNTIAFVGYWQNRKGRRDWPEIVARVVAEHPSARFQFLGTGTSSKRVLAEVGERYASQLTVVPNFRSDELPRLLGQAGLGAFPAYMEGFPFAVLEMLAAGLPVVAFDTPGARETLQGIDPTLLTPAGDAAAFADRLIALLKAPAAARDKLAHAAGACADQFRWDDIATRTLAEYEHVISTNRLPRERGSRLA